MKMNWLMISFLLLTTTAHAGINLNLGDNSMISTKLLRLPITKQHLIILRNMEHTYPDNPHLKDLKNEVEFYLYFAKDKWKSEHRYKEILVRFLGSVFLGNVIYDDLVDNSMIGDGLDKDWDKKMKLKYAISLVSTISPNYQDRSLEYLAGVANEFDDDTREYLLEVAERLYEYWQANEVELYTDILIELWKFADQNLGSTVYGGSYPVR